MKNTNSTLNIPVIKYQPGRLENIKNALEENGKQEAEKSLGTRLKENLQTPFYLLKGVASSVVDTASFVLDVAAKPVKTGEKMGAGLLTAYQALSESSADQKLDWLTHKTVQTIQTSPHERAEAVGYLAGSVLVGKGITKGIKLLSELGEVAARLEKMTEKIIAIENKTIKMADIVTEAKPKAPLTFNKLAEGVVKPKETGKLANKILTEQSQKEIESSYNKLLRGNEKEMISKSVRIQSK